MSATGRHPILKAHTTLQTQQAVVQPAVSVDEERISRDPRRASIEVVDGVVRLLSGRRRKEMGQKRPVEWDQDSTLLGMAGTCHILIVRVI